MSKELIVSVNGREKKIAIIENEQVTEFYIERGEENQGIVGNIYKGRVMRVLPGMQSAFVDIGLERDAFLYVSDFFDEEEEFERIVLDKSKKGETSETAARAASERIEQSRIEREQKIEAAQERVEPLAARSESDDSKLDADDTDLSEEFAAGMAGAESNDQTVMMTAVQEAAPPPAVASTDVAPQHPAQQAQSTEGEERGGRRGRRGRRGGKDFDESRRDAAKPGQKLAAPMTGTVEADTPFAVGGDSFQRIVDEDERAADEGELFKDARIQERITGQIHTIEFKEDGVPVAEVGSILPEAQASGSFQRIDDSDIADETAGASRESRVQATVAANVSAFIDEVKDDTLGAQSFERISDDEKAAEGVGIQTTLTDSETGGKRGRGRGAAKQKEAPTRGKTKAATNVEAAADETSDEPTATKRGSKKAASKFGATKSASKSSAKSTASKESSTKTAARKSGGKTAAAKGRKRASSTASDEGETQAAGAAQPAEGHGDDRFYDDAEARILMGRFLGEFATRRGGRRRRRPGGKPGEGGAEDEQANGKDVEASAEVEETGVAAAPPAPKAAPTPAATPAPTPAPTPAAAPTQTGQSPAPRRDARRDRPERNSRDERSGNRNDRNDRSDRNDRPANRDERPSGGRGGQRDSGGGGGRRDRQQPTITDLLREGQEVLVQIAKEPIAKKGARITSHIALPGRFLVYMPTVEHVGVSRKIESDSERVRLRKLIAAIRTEEDVPSGGFIVRTAGIGISEADLRDDARYLVRTWLDIKRGAEKMKAPAIAHQDLDLVQRILRDQLSDDFTAIRVDSEEEYLRVVEFINRIQPRMVKRVKLHTRDEPILETYGVQAEIDKAIKPRVWLRSGGYLVINQTEALVAIDVNTGKFVGRGGSRLEDTITRTNLEAVEEIVRQIRLRDLGGIIVLDLIDMEDRRNRNRVMQVLQDALQDDKSPTKVLSFNDFGLVIMTRKRVKQSLERTLCSPCPYCVGAGLVKSPQTVCYEILEEARRLARGMNGEIIKQTTLRTHPEVARALRSTEGDVLLEIEAHLGAVDLTSDGHIHQEQFDFAFI